MPGISYRYTHSSFRHIANEFDKVKKKHERGFEAGAKQAGRFLLARSKELVPVDTGLLKSTGVMLAEGEGFNTVVTVSYGSPEAHYALYVHEDMNAAHAYPTQAKFLEQPAEQYAMEMGEMVRTRMERGR